MFLLILVVHLQELRMFVEQHVFEQHGFFYANACCHRLVRVERYWKEKHAKHVEQNRDFVHDT